MTYNFHFLKAKNSTLRSKQTWRRSKENNEGWFTLKNERSSLFLNWNSLRNLTIEGNVLLYTGRFITIQ